MTKNKKAKRIKLKIQNLVKLLAKMVKNNVIYSDLDVFFYFYSIIINYKSLIILSIEETFLYCWDFFVRFLSVFGIFGTFDLSKCAISQKQ